MLWKHPFQIYVNTYHVEVWNVELPTRDHMTTYKCDAPPVEHNMLHLSPWPWIPDMCRSERMRSTQCCLYSYVVCLDHGKSESMLKFKSPIRLVSHIRYSPPCFCWCFTSWSVSQKKSNKPPWLMVEVCWNSEIWYDIFAHGILKDVKQSWAWGLKRCLSQRRRTGIEAICGPIFRGTG